MKMKHVIGCTELSSSLFEGTEAGLPGPYTLTDSHTHACNRQLSPPPGALSSLPFLLKTTFSFNNHQSMGGKLSTFFLFILLNIRHVRRRGGGGGASAGGGRRGGVAKSSLSSCQYFPP